MKVVPKVAYCMNLDKRTDRWNQVLKDCEQLPFEIKRISAVENLKCPQNGVATTFKNIIKSSINEPFILIIEDDLQILDSEKVITSLQNVPDDWDILLGGAYYFHSNKNVILDNWIKCTDFCSLHFIIINKKIYDIILNIENKGLNFDRILGPLSSSTINTYLMYPMPCCQRPGFSDLHKKYVDYSYFNLPWIKNIVNN